MEDLAFSIKDSREVSDLSRSSIKQLVGSKTGPLMSGNERGGNGIQDYPSARNGRRALLPSKFVDLYHNGGMIAGSESLEVSVQEKQQE